MLSAVWDAQQKLYDLLYADATLASQKVDVTLGGPTELMREHVWVSGEVDDWTARYATTGLRNKDEDFTLRVHVFVDRTTNTFSDTRDRVKALGQVVEALVSTNYTLDGTVQLAQVGSASMEETYNDMDRRRAILLTMNVRCRAWLTE